MNSGRYLFVISAEAHAVHALAKLGYDSESHGHRTHAISYVLNNTPLVGSVIKHINNERRKLFLAERDQQKNSWKERLILWDILPHNYSTIFLRIFLLSILIYITNVYFRINRMIT